MCKVLQLMQSSKGALLLMFKFGHYHRQTWALHVVVFLQMSDLHVAVLSKLEAVLPTTAVCVNLLPICECPCFVEQLFVCSSFLERTHDGCIEKMFAWRLLATTWPMTTVNGCSHSLTFLPLFNCLSIIHLRIYWPCIVSPLSIS